MSNKVLQLQGCEMKGSTFQSRISNFPNRDISQDLFYFKVRTQWKNNIEEVQGEKFFDHVVFPFSELEKLPIGNYNIEYWANFNGIGTEIIAYEDFRISDTPCEFDYSKEDSFTLNFPNVSINYEMTIAVVNIGSTDGGGNGLPGKSAYQSYLDTTLDNPKKTEAEWSDLKDGVDGKDFKYSDFTPEQIENLKVKGDPFLYSDFTPQQLADLSLSFDDLTLEQKEELSGLNEVTDIYAACEAGGLVNLKPITYELTAPLIIANGTIIKGVTGKTILKCNGTEDAILLDVTNSDITFEDIIFQGIASITPATMTAAQVKLRTGIGTQNAIRINGKAKNIIVNRCGFINFNGCGIYVTQTSGLFKSTFKFTNNYFHNNYLGMFLFSLAEYHQFIGNTFSYNKIGAWVEGGNNFGSTNHFNANGIGVVVSGQNGNNDTHGGISNSTFNHNLSYSLFAIKVNVGYTFNGCHFFQGDIYIENSKGVVICGGEIAAGINIVTENTGVNMIINNIFFKTFNGGNVTAGITKVRMLGNMFIDGSDSSTINNSI